MVPPSAKTSSTSPTVTRRPVSPTMSLLDLQSRRAWTEMNTGSTSSPLPRASLRAIMAPYSPAPAASREDYLLNVIDDALDLLGERPVQATRSSLVAPPPQRNRRGTNANFPPTN
ncbi:expressed unknown protein [Seminavis robusta]|uniref:Uncharacterized protein n=1 Tax=Seminavis robusta TaxID=568900 RepID=A0A9N8DT30_9STRA|nr:expressed unknown protein [Seminavis robusta]|eukprot:Sro261_g101790.1 n/a (115) ;mRNA; r:52681-53025